MAIDAMPNMSAPGANGPPGGFPGGPGVDPMQAQGGFGGGYGGPPGGGGYGGPPGGGGYGGPPGGGQPPGGGGYGGPPGGGGYGGPPGGAPPGGGGYGGPPGGAPPGGGGYGGPPGGAPPGGGGYGAPPGGGGYGAPPGGGGYGAPPQQQQGFGAPMGQFGQQAAGMMQAGMGGPMGPVGARPQRRNPIMVLLMPAAIIVVGQIIGGILGSLIDPMVGLVGTVIALGGVIFALITLFKMLGELKNFTGDADFAPWFILIPCLQYYFAWVKVPEQVTKAKQMAGVQAPTRSIIVYIFLFQYALAADLNDLAG